MAQKPYRRTTTKKIIVKRGVRKSPSRRRVKTLKKPLENVEDRITIDLYFFQQFLKNRNN